MSTELSNGVIIPEEYSDDWYDEMSINLRKLNDVIGSDLEKLNSNDVAFLRMSSAALTDGGTGNFSDLNSSNKLKTGDYVLDSGRKLYQVVSVDSTNETFTVGNSLFKITAESDLAPVAESGDYDDLDNKPDLNPYDQHIADTDIHVTTADKTKWNNGVSQSYVFRYSGTAVVPNSTIAYSTIDNTDNIKAGDKILDVDGKLFEITAVDTTNQTVTVGSALIDLALDANVVHTSGNETVRGNKTFVNGTRLNDWLYFTNALVTKGTIPQSSVTPYRIYFGSGTNYANSLFNIDTSVSNTGVQSLIFRSAENVVNGDDARFALIYDPNRTQPRYLAVKGGIEPNANKVDECGTSTKKWATFNGLNPGSLSLPDFSNAVDISGYITVTSGSTTENLYTPLTDGYISVNLGRSSGAIGLVLSNGKIEACVRENTLPDNHRECGGFIPVQKNDTVVITSCLADSIIWAYFIPCLGNV